MRRPVIAIACKGHELADKLAESIAALVVDPARLPSTEALHVTHSTPFTLTPKGWHATGSRGCA